MLDEKTVKENIRELKLLNDQRRAKYYRNYSFYNNTPKMSLDNIKDPSCVGYYSDIDEVNDDTTPTPSLNVIKSCIDTLHSKIAQSKVRPYFNCINGSYKDICIVKQAQQFFDQYYDIEDVNKKVSEAFRDSCIFDTGYIYIDPDNKAITRALPWQVFERPSELTYNNVTRTYYERVHFPVTMLPDFVFKAVKEKIDQLQYITYGVYYDALEQTKAYYIPGFNYIKVASYDGNRTPFVRLHYNNPVFGNTSSSIVDMLFSIQMEINTLMNKVKDASQLNAAMTYFVPSGTNIKTGQLNNRVGNVFQYDSTPNMTSSPVTVSTPAFIDPEYLTLIDNLKANAYELVGISQLSAQSKKPAGLNSGVALQTMEDVESDRFETQLNQVIRAYVDIAKTCLRVFAKEDNILPEDSMRLDIKWADIVEEVQKMQIQFSAADSLSKDPSTKLQQLLALAQAGIIPQSRIAQFMEIPDLQGGYTISTNSLSACLSVIDDCIDNEVYDIPAYIPLETLEEEILNTQLSLRAANYDLNKESIDRLSRLYSVAKKKLDEMNARQSPAPAPAPAPEVPAEQNPVPGAETVEGQTIEGMNETPEVGGVPMDNSTLNADINVMPEQV